jgi:hypothetical protein
MVLRSKSGRVIRPSADWDRLKQEYIRSDKREVKAFLREKGLLDKYTQATISTRTRTWNKERKELNDSLLEKAKKNVTSLVISNEKLLKLKDNILISVGNKVSKHNDTLTGQELKVLWEIVKTELGEPTSVNKNINENKQVIFTFASNLDKPEGQIIDVK